MVFCVLRSIESIIVNYVVILWTYANHNKMKQENKENLDEIDLRDLKNFVVSFFDTIGLTIYRIVSFCISKWIYFILAIGLGLGLGYYKDSQMVVTETIDYKIVLSPKYGSFDYLSQLTQDKFAHDFNDQLVLASSLSAVNDIYGFIDDNLKLETFKALDEGDKYAATTKNYQYQVLKITGASDFNIERFTANLVRYFDTQPYFAQRKEIGITALALEKTELSSSLEAINTYIDGINSGKLSSGKETFDIVKALKLKEKLTTSIVENNVAILEGGHTIFILETLHEKNAIEATTMPSKRMVKYAIGFGFALLVVFGFIQAFRRYRKN